MTCTCSARQLDGADPTQCDYCNQTVISKEDWQGLQDHIDDYFGISPTETADFMQVLMSKLEEDK